MKRNDFSYKLYHYSSYLNYILYWFEANFIFIVLNIPLILGMIGLKPTLATFPIYFLLAQTVLPSLYVLTKSISGISQNNGVFMESLRIIKHELPQIFKKTWFLTVLLAIEVMNLIITAQKPQLNMLWWLNVILLAFTATYVVNLMLVMSAWDLQGTTALKLTLKLSIVKSVRYYFSLLIIVSTFILLRLFSVYILLFGMALAIHMCIINFRPVVDFVNSRPENK